MFKNVLVPTDGSELSASTVARAIDFAKDAGARIIFFYAQPISRRRFTAKGHCSIRQPPNSSTGQPQPKQRRSSPRPNQQQKLRV